MRGEQCFHCCTDCYCNIPTHFLTSVRRKLQLQVVAECQCSMMTLGFLFSTFQEAASFECDSVLIVYYVVK